MYVWVLTIRWFSYFSHAPWRGGQNRTGGTIMQRCIYGNRKRKQLVPAVVSFAKKEHKQEELMGLVATRGRRRPKFCKKKNWDVVAHRRACLLEFWNKFSSVSSTQKTCFQTQKCWIFDKFTFWESNIWEMYVSCMSWCMWCVRGRLQVGHSEDKSKADQWVLKQRECSGIARVNKVTSASLGYPLSVFKNSTVTNIGLIKTKQKTHTHSQIDSL